MGTGWVALTGTGHPPVTGCRARDTRGWLAGWEAFARKVAGTKGRPGFGKEQESNGASVKWQRTILHGIVSPAYEARAQVLISL